jgi:hypothetical protein
LYSVSEERQGSDTFEEDSYILLLLPEKIPVLFDKETWMSMSADVKDDACERLLMPFPRIPAPAALEHPAHQVTPGTPDPALADPSPHSR